MKLINHMRGFVFFRNRLRLHHNRIPSELRVQHHSHVDVLLPILLIQHRAAMVTGRQRVEF